MLSNLHFANKTILSCFFFFLLIIDLYILIPAVITQIFNLIAELVIPIGIPAKEAKSEMETYPVIVEITKVSSQYNSKFYASYSLIYFDLFLELDNFLFHIFFLVWVLDFCFVQAWLYISI